MRRSSVLFLVFAVTATGCGSTKEPSTTNGPVIPVSDFQSGILEDGVVTFEEYEQAKLAEANCMETTLVEEHQIQAEAELQPDIIGRMLQVGVEWTPNYAPGVVELTPEEELVYDRIFELVRESCYNEFSSHVETAWARATELSEDERLAAVQSAKECLQTAGVEVPDSILTVEELGQFNIDNHAEMSDNRTASDCMFVFVTQISTAPPD